MLIGFTVNDALKPKPVDWRPTFNTTDKIPYGMYIFYQELPQLFTKSAIKTVENTPYEYLTSVYDVMKDSYATHTSYLFISPNAEIDEISQKFLLEFVDEGNQVFISANQFPQYLTDTLQFETDLNFHDGLIKIDSITNKIITDELKITLSFANKKLDTQSYLYKKGLDDYYFSKFDTLQTTVLGYQKTDQKQRVNFIKVAYGKGYFLLHTQPFVFTNYHLLYSPNNNYVAHTLSYVPNHQIIWDNSTTKFQNLPSTPLRYILSQPALRWAWYITLAGIVFFMIFKAKRTQRVIPVIPKLPNTSIEFAKTIGNLYYQEGNPDDIVQKKINYFLEFIRNTYLIDTQNLNADFKKRLHAKSGVALLEIERLIDFIIQLHQQKNISERKLVLLDQMIYQFYQKSKLKTS